MLGESGRPFREPVRRRKPFEFDDEFEFEFDAEPGRRGRKRVLPCINTVAEALLLVPWSKYLFAFFCARLRRRVRGAGFRVASPESQCPGRKRGARASPPRPEATARAGGGGPARTGGVLAGLQRSRFMD